jgi:hypothetical protein
VAARQVRFRRALPRACVRARCTAAALPLPAALSTVVRHTSLRLCALRCSPQLRTQLWWLPQPLQATAAPAAPLPPLRQDLLSKVFREAHAAAATLQVSCASCLACWLPCTRDARMS